MRKTIHTTLAVAAMALGTAAALHAQETTTSTTTTAPAAQPAPSTDSHATSPNANAAVNTSSANTPMPAAGANSFTENQAKKRLAKGGFTAISHLKKDKNGVWRGTATHDGASVPVWVDYRGDIGQS